MDSRSYKPAAHSFIFPDDGEAWKRYQLLPHDIQVCQGCGLPRLNAIHVEGAMPEADEDAPIGSPEHRMWFHTAPRLCMELIHGCGLTPPKPCLPCMRTKGHEVPHAMFWDYRQEYPSAPIYPDLKGE